MSECKETPIDKIRFLQQERKHFDQELLADLAGTIKMRGVLQPIGVAVNGDWYDGLWGERRYLAAKLAGLTTIPAIVRGKPAADADAMEIRLIENLARIGLRPIEQATALRQFQQAKGLTSSQVALRLGMRPSAVCRSLALLELPEPIRERVEEGAISPAAGYELGRVKNSHEQADLAARVASGELSRDGLVGAIKDSQRRASRGEGKHTGATARLGGNRQVTVRGDNLTVESFIATLEDLLARCRAARTKGLSLRTLLNVLSDEARRTTPSKGA
jgi:ParB family chromosome partitioning protein